MNINEIICKNQKEKDERDKEWEEKRKEWVNKRFDD